MTSSRNVSAIALIALASVVVAISFAGVASGAASPAVPNRTVIVHANAGQTAHVSVGASCGNFITVTAYGTGGGFGAAGCGSISTAAPACLFGCFNDTFVTFRTAAFVCQANARFAISGVTAVCTEGTDD